MTGYPPPDDDPADDEIGQRFLEELRTELENTLEDFGRTEWRKARARQIHRLRQLGWTNTDLAEHYALTKSAVSAILAKQGIQTSEWRITFTGTQFDANSCREHLNERGIDCKVTAQ